jgi:glycosyltransferase involved in cell wall biosynthesis
MTQPAVSVVTPFHNTGRWLAQCIESVLAQSFGDYEYLLIDNASTDDGREIAERYGRLDRRIRVIATDRLLPQVANYNFALSRISPETSHCNIVQADDWIFPEFLGASLKLAKKHPDIALVSSFALEGTGVVQTGIPVDRPVMPGREACRGFFRTRLYGFGSPTAQLWRADLVRGRQAFYDDRAAPFEDADVCFELLDGRSFGFVHQVLSYTRRQEGSIFDRLDGFGWLEAFRLVTLRRWGRRYLSEAEYEALHEDWWRDYRAVLVEGKARAAGDEFWSFHTRMMAAANLEDAAKGLFMPMLGWYLDRIGNPKRTCENLVRRLRDRAMAGRVTGAPVANESVPEHDK